MKEINLVVMATSPCVFMVVILRHVRPCLKYDGCVCSPKKVVKNLELRVIYPVGMASYKPFTVEFNGLRLDLADLKAPTTARAQFNVTCPASRVDVAPQSLSVQMCTVWSVSPTKKSTATACTSPPLGTALCKVARPFSVRFGHRFFFHKNCRLERGDWSRKGGKKGGHRQKTTHDTQYENKEKISETPEGRSGFCPLFFFSFFFSFFSLF